MKRIFKLVIIYLKTKKFNILLLCCFSFFNFKNFNLIKTFIIQELFLNSNLLYYQKR